MTSSPPPPHTLAVDTAGLLADHRGREPSSVVEESEDLEHESCCICLEGKDFVLTSCCHLFCLSCITRWLEINGTCPICRNEFESGVELFNLFGTVAETAGAIKELHKRKRELEKRKEAQMLARRSEASGGWGLLQQMVGLLFLGPEDEPSLDEELELDLASQLALLRLARVNLSGRMSQNVSLSHNHAQLNASPSFPFLSFCCLPQSSAPPMSVSFERMSVRSRIH